PFQLPRNGKISRLAKKIFPVINRAVGIPGGVVEVQGSYLKHLPGTFGIRTRNDWRMHVNKPALIKKLVYGKGKCIAYLEYGIEGVRAETKVRNFAKEFEAMFFRL